MPKDRWPGDILFWDKLLSSFRSIHFLIVFPKVSCIPMGKATIHWVLVDLFWSTSLQPPLVLSTDWGDRFLFFICQAPGCPHFTFFADMYLFLICPNNISVASWPLPAKSVYSFFLSGCFECSIITGFTRYDSTSKDEWDGISYRWNASRVTTIILFTFWGNKTTL